MSEKLKDGGPAFPLQESLWQNGMPFDANGLTKREWFAGMALQGYLAGRNAPFIDGHHIRKESVAIACYGYADAMLAALEKEDQP